MKSLFNHFEVLEDPRDIRGKRHELINVLIMTIYGILCGYTDFTNLADFLKVYEEYFIIYYIWKMAHHLMILFLMFLVLLILKNLWNYLLNG